jgi:hypothetical protein
MYDAPLCGVAQHPMDDPMRVQPRAIRYPAHGGVHALQIGRAELLDRQRSDPFAHMFAK